MGGARSENKASGKEPGRHNGSSQTHLPLLQVFVPDCSSRLIDGVLILEPDQLCFQSLRDLCILPVPIEIGHLVGILEQIVQLPLAHLVETDELVAVGPHALMLVDHVHGGELVVVVVQALAPAAGRGG